MSLIKRMRKQFAIYWPFIGSDQYGVKSFGEPVQIKVRWENKAGEFVNAQGFTMASNAMVYVDRVVKVGDKLKYGSLDSDTLASPLEDRDAFEVKAVESIPNLKAKESLQIAHL